jgi:transcriptional regulator with XRE-family HTH domain
MSGPASSAVEPQCLREARIAVGLSQAELAAVLVVNHATVSRWESGLRRPPHDLLEPLATRVGVPVEVVGSWFAHMRWLKGDGIGQVPGLMRLLQDHGVGIQAAAEASGVSVEQMRDWVIGGRTLQRAALEPLAGLLGMSREEFVAAARHPPDSGQTTMSVLRQARLARRLTQDELGCRVGVAGETVSHWERGKWVPPAHQVFRLARVLRVDPWQLGAGLGVRMPDARESLPVDDMGFGRLLQLARLRAGLTRAQLARCIGVRSVTVGRWEAGQCRPRGLRRERLERVLGFDVLATQQMKLPGPTGAVEASPDRVARQLGRRICA